MLEEKKEATETLLDEEGRVVDPELIVGDVTTEDEDDDGTAEDEEVDPFKDRWEE